LEAGYIDGGQFKSDAREDTSVVLANRVYSEEEKVALLYLPGLK
jgi:hypothetical protein